MELLLIGIICILLYRTGKFNQYSINRLIRKYCFRTVSCIYLLKKIKNFNLEKLKKINIYKNTIKKVIEY